MSHDVTAGLVDPKNSIEIIKLKIEMILLAVMTQTLTMLEHYEEEDEKKDAYARLKLNLGYLTDIVIPYTLKMDLLNGIELNSKKPLNYITR